MVDNEKLATYFKNKELFNIASNYSPNTHIKTLSEEELEELMMYVTDGSVFLPSSHVYTLTRVDRETVDRLLLTVVELWNMYNGK